MAGNRMKLKNGLFVTMLLATPFFGYGLEKKHVQGLDTITAQADSWAQILKNLKNMRGSINKAALLAKLELIIQDSDNVLSSIPDVPEADKLLKGMITDIKVGLENTLKGLKTNVNIVKLKQMFGGNNCSFKDMLDKTEKDLNGLMQRIANHPDEYTQEALAALKEYKATTFKAFYDRWHNMSSKEFTELIIRANALK